MQPITRTHGQQAPYTHSFPAALLSLSFRCWSEGAEDCNWSSRERSRKNGQGVNVEAKSRDICWLCSLERAFSYTQDILVFSSLSCPLLAQLALLPMVRTHPLPLSTCPTFSLPPGSATLLLLCRKAINVCVKGAWGKQRCQQQRSFPGILTFQKLFMDTQDKEKPADFTHLHTLGRGMHRPFFFFGFTPGTGSFFHRREYIFTGFTWRTTFRWLICSYNLRPG